MPDEVKLSCEEMVERALADARNTLAKTAIGCFDRDAVTIPGPAFNSALRNIDKARAAIEAARPTIVTGQDEVELVKVYRLGWASGFRNGGDPVAVGPSDRELEEEARVAIARVPAQQDGVVKEFVQALEGIERIAEKHTGVSGSRSLQVAMHAISHTARAALAQPGPSK